MVLGNVYDISRGEWRSDANSLISTQELWFAVFMTVLYVSQVYRHRKVAYKSQHPHSLVNTSKSGRGSRNRTSLPVRALNPMYLHVHQPSPKVAILKFNRGMQQGLLGRIGRTSIMEYHAFGIISEGRKSPHHYMICGVQGDFTKSLVDDPPKTVWTRELKFGMLGDIPL